MSRENNKMGFTLIELLIVIAIIAVLAVAFLPTLLGAPAKGRDTARIASLQKIQKVLINANIEGRSYPASACIKSGASFGGTDSTYYLAALGGALPSDPQTTNTVPAMSTLTSCVGGYRYILAPGSYDFGLYAHMEVMKNANSACGGSNFSSIVAVNPSVPGQWCYVILSK